MASLIFWPYWRFCAPYITQIKYQIAAFCWCSRFKACNHVCSLFRKIAYSPWHSNGKWLLFSYVLIIARSATVLRKHSFKSSNYRHGWKVVNYWKKIIQNLDCFPPYRNNIHHQLTYKISLYYSRKVRYVCNSDGVLLLAGWVLPFPLHHGKHSSPSRNTGHCLQTEIICVIIYWFHADRVVVCNKKAQKWAFSTIIGQIYSGVGATLIRLSPLHHYSVFNGNDPWWPNGPSHVPIVLWSTSAASIRIRTIASHASIEVGGALPSHTPKRVFSTEYNFYFSLRNAFDPGAHLNLNEALLRRRVVYVLRE